MRNGEKYSEKTITEKYKQFCMENNIYKDLFPQCKMVQLSNFLGFGIGVYRYKKRTIDYKGKYEQ